ncbi:GNAT family N-acetyltransferase [Xanthomarina gelatinilytica]|uniref:GNAT family N-acetyltransferase n=1 Tax=Xanthomarina gelatinilytica TaxID=1137281 RepID=UPI003AA84BE5
MKDDLIELLIEVNKFEKILSEQINIFKYVDKIYQHAIIHTIYEKARLKGFIAFYANTSDKQLAYLTMIAVHPSSHGEGIGSVLLLAVLEQLKIKGYNKLGLEVLETNKHAIAFYESHGFYFVESRANQFIFMEKIVF